MDDKFEKELKKLAKKYGMRAYFECLYCGHTNEVIGSNDDDCYMVTFVKEENKDEE